MSGSKPVKGKPVFGNTSPEVCPYCGGNITGGRFQSDGNIVWQEVECQVCHALWDEVYQYAYFEVKYEGAARPVGTRQE